MSCWTMLDQRGHTVRVEMPPRFIVNDTGFFLPMNVVEEIMQLWERSPFPPSKQWKLTRKGFEHARQQALKEKLRGKWMKLK